MAKIAYGGKNYYGVDVGVIMLDSTFPRIEGDIGNALTWDYPVVYKRVRGGTPKKVVLDLEVQDITPFIIAAKELEEEGVKIITTSCGFLSLFQRRLVECVDIPVVTSALLIIPMLQNMLSKNDKIGVLTANSDTLSTKHLEAVGIKQTDNLVIYGLQNEEVFTNFTVQNWNKVDIDKCRSELEMVTRRMLDENRDIKMIVLECTNMPPFSKYIQEIAQLPVFDIVSLINMMRETLNHKEYIK